MTRGLSRDQVGITDAMIEAFGEVVFKLSHNHQVRRGDPIRERDFEDIERQRADLGLSDAEIAARVGLSRDQVTFIRNFVERRQLRSDTYHRLAELGGGRRFRTERHTDFPDRPRFSEAAMTLRDAMTYDSDTVRRYVDAGYWKNDTLRSWLDRWAAEAPDRAAIEAGGTVIPYAEFAGRVRRLAAALHGIGVGKGDVVAVQLPNTPEYLIAYLAMTYIGAVLTTIYMPYREQESETLLRHSRSRAVICPAAIGDFPAAEAMVGLKDRIETLEHVIVHGDAVEGATSLAALMENETESLPEDEPVGADPFMLLYTSGTTTSPKGVPLNYHTMLGNTLAGIGEHGIEAEDRILSPAPFGHLYGLYSIHLALAVGATQVLLPQFTPPDLAKTIAQAKPTVMFAAPAHMNACLGMGLLDGLDMSPMRRLFLAGSAVAPELVHAIYEHLDGGHVIQLWGMTELQAGAYSRPGDPIDVVASSAGRPSPGTEVRVMGDDGKELGPGEEGELQVRGPLMFPGYLDNEDANRAAFTEDGWFLTGDLACLDDAGNVSITGRSKDVINRGGVKYNPRDVEELLEDHPKIAQAAIVPVPDDVLGEKACCFAVATEGETPTLDDLATYLAKKGIAKIKLPERLELIGAMPMTATRKVIKGRLIESLSQS